MNNGETAIYDESCSSTLASTFSNSGEPIPGAGVVNRLFKVNFKNITHF